MTFNWFDLVLKIMGMEYHGVPLLQRHKLDRNSRQKNLWQLHRRCLPPYSPDLNPIEKCWGWLKRKIRRGRKYYESIRETLDGVIGMLD